MTFGKAIRSQWLLDDTITFLNHGSFGACPRKVLEAVRDAGGTLVYLLGIGAAATHKRAEEFHDDFPDVAYLAMAELFGKATGVSKGLGGSMHFFDAERHMMAVILNNDDETTTGIPPIPLSFVADAVKRLDAPPPAPFHTSELALVRSYLDGPSPRYEVLSHHP